ncbi:MAG TPA: B12-binding domain-containing radical SAM protein, partial [Thermoanaerobaculia bacterium]|nr:B12-binding domain-containing radical SAM protein [Thermoanaerobaculia bacterium]
SDPGVFLTTVAYPIKNTAYYKEVAGRVVPPQSWAEGSDRDHAIRGRHSRTYYRHADQWLRQEVESFRLAGSDPARSAELRDAAARSREALLASAGEVEA